MTDFPVAGLEAGREALRRFLAGEDDLSAMHTKIALIATETIPGCDVASITTVLDGRPTTPAFTAKKALLLDEAQYRGGAGPCLAAIAHRGPEHVTIAAETRWPEFVTVAVDNGVLATFSVPLGTDDAVIGALNLYSETRPRFDEESQRLACLFADQLGVAAATVTRYAESYELAQQLQQAMESRACIEQAKGILMAAQRCTPQEAFEILVRASQGRNRKLRAIAMEIVERYAASDGHRASS
ncbi:MAG TPA: GAF and ANTAR domain-containing protein [Acidimicrobiales bacterium]|nr:GAF and ANTAR domain-containing protein [Acidimicrobiales bacterium]